MDNEKIKVLHIIGALNLGGAETMIMNILRNIDRDKYQFDFYLSGNTGGYYEQEAIDLGAKIVNVGRRKKNPVKYCVTLFKLIRAEKYDVIQIHATDAQDGLSALVTRLAGAKKICLFSHNTSGQSLFRQRVMRRLFMWAVTDPQACSDMAGEWMFGKNRRLVKIIPLPINCEFCKFDSEIRSAEREEYKLTQYKVIGHIGRFQQQKNHIRLIKMFAALIKSNPEYRLVLIGTGVLENEIMELIYKLGLQEYIICMGQVNMACKKLSMFDLLLLPSLYEGFPTVLLEAQANGLPIIASDTITPTIALTDLVHFLSLNDTDLKWVDQIQKVTGRPKRNEMYYKIIENTYDVKKVTEIFSEIYSKR